MGWMVTNEASHDLFVYNIFSLSISMSSITPTSPFGTNRPNLSAGDYIQYKKNYSLYCKYKNSMPSQPSECCVKQLNIKYIKANPLQNCDEYPPTKPYNNTSLLTNLYTQLNMNQVDVVN